MPSRHPRRMKLGVLCVLCGSSFSYSLNRKDAEEGLSNFKFSASRYLCGGCSRQFHALNPTVCAANCRTASYSSSASMADSNFPVFDDYRDLTFSFGVHEHFIHIVAGCKHIEIFNASVLGIVLTGCRRIGSACLSVN
jgi:hypothetical protein